MRALPCGSCFLRLRMPRSPSRHPLAGAAEQLRRDGTFAIATSSPSPFRAPSRLRCTSPSRVRCAGAARVARRRNSSLHDGSAVFARANRPRARFRCRRASRSTMGAATRPNTHRIASHRIASHRIASHRIASKDPTPARQVSPPDTTRRIGHALRVRPVAPAVHQALGACRSGEPHIAMRETVAEIAVEIGFERHVAGRFP